MSHPLPLRFRALSTLVALTALTACGPAEGPTWDEPKTGEAELAAVVCPDGATVEGIDVSEWQGVIDWSKVAASGIDFAIARVAHGLYKDAYFDQNWAAIQNVGLVRGTYQYFSADVDPIAQADLLLNAIGPLGPLDLPPILDVESTDGQSAATIAANVGAWIQHVESATGRKPIIYTGKYFWKDNVMSTAFVDYPLWIPNYSLTCPDLADGYWDDWLMFQYSSTGSIPGIGGNVDRNQFNGDLNDLLAFAGGGAYYAAEFVSQSFPYASQGAVQIPAGDNLEVTISLRNSGTASWDSATRLATTEPRDRVSVFAGEEWPGDNRYAAVEGVVAPGETYDFTFTLHAPKELGTYDERFGLVQEGVAWFSDPGQGGPPDNQLEGIFEVIAAVDGSGAGGGASTSAGVGAGPSSGEGGSDETEVSSARSTGACSASSAPSGSGSAAWFFVAATAVVLRRRR